ncbi:MAG: MFS transporter [Bryobacteraceae bacterium]
MFILCFLDRVNLSYAALDMNRDLHFSPTTYGLGAGMFFWGYLLFEIPAAKLVERSARIWLGLMLIVWGVAATLMGTIHGVKEFYIYRVVLGVAESGFFPGIVIYLSRWFPKADRARAIASLAIGLPAANLIGAPLSSWLLYHHWGSIPGWRWIYIVEGFPSVIAGIATMLLLTDKPRDANWLTPGEKAWLEGALTSEQHTSAHQAPTVQTLLSLPFLLLLAIWFLDNVGVYGFNLWLPMMIRKLADYPSPVVVAIASTPFIGALFAAAFVSRSSDASGERRWHTALPMLTFGCGLSISVLFGGDLWLSLAALMIAALGLTSGTPGFWALATSSSAIGSVQIAVITSGGALGGMCGPYLMGYFREVTGDFEAGVMLLASSVMCAAFLVLTGFRGDTRKQASSDTS